MPNTSPHTSAPRSGWAPWYHYVLALAVSNAVAQAAGLRHTPALVNTGVTVALIALVMAAVTWRWRRGDPPRPR